MGSRFTEAHLCHTRADYHLARGEWDRAEPLHQKALDLFGPQPGDLTQAQLELQTAQIAAGRGDQIQAEEKFLQARSFEADKMAARFASACQSIGTDHWLQALCKAMEMSEALAAEKARFCRMAETMVHDLKNKMVSLNMALKRAETKKEKGGDFWRYVAMVQVQGLYRRGSFKNGGGWKGRRFPIPPAWDYTIPR